MWIRTSVRCIYKFKKYQNRNRNTFFLFYKTRCSLSQILILFRMHLVTYYTKHTAFLITPMFSRAALSWQIQKVQRTWHTNINCLYHFSLYYLIQVYQLAVAYISFVFTWVETNYAKYFPHALEQQSIFFNDQNVHLTVIS